jgi:hypothetical protein
VDASLCVTLNDLCGRTALAKRHNRQAAVAASRSTACRYLATNARKRYSNFRYFLRLTDAKCLIEYHDECSDEFIINALNKTPMKPIGYDNGLERMKSRVAELMKK